MIPRWGWCSLPSSSSSSSSTSRESRCPLTSLFALLLLPRSPRSSSPSLSPMIDWQCVWMQWLSLSLTLAHSLCLQRSSSTPFSQQAEAGKMKKPVALERGGHGSPPQGHALPSQLRTIHCPTHTCNEGVAGLVIIIIIIIKEEEEVVVVRMFSWVFSFVDTLVTTNRFVSQSRPCQWALKAREIDTWIRVVAWLTPWPSVRHWNLCCFHHFRTD